MSFETKERYIQFWVVIKLDAMLIDVKLSKLSFSSTALTKECTELQDILRSQLHSVVKLVWQMLAARALSWNHIAPEHM